MLPPGTRITGYVIEGVLGEGGMGVVYEARQEALRRKVALKLLAPEFARDATFTERFRREGVAQATIEHPHIVPVYEAGESPTGLFLAMRLIRGPTLKDLIQAGDLEAQRVLRLLAPIARALDAPHAEGVVHRDVKPGSILIGADDHPYLADFGLTKIVGDLSLTRTGHFAGTIDYTAPELIAGERATDLSDIYALGAVLYQCFTGGVPFPRPTEAATMFAHVNEAPPRVTERRPDLPAALDRVIAKALSKDPADRHQRATALIDDARGALDALAAPAPMPPRPTPRPDETERRPVSRPAPRPPRSIVFAFLAITGGLLLIASLIVPGGRPFLSEAMSLWTYHGGFGARMAGQVACGVLLVGAGLMELVAERGVPDLVVLTSAGIGAGLGASIFCRIWCLRWSARMRGTSSRSRAQCSPLPPRSGRCAADPWRPRPQRDAVTALPS